MSTPSPLLTKFDFNRYIWRPFTAANGSDARARMLGGGEHAQDIWNRYHKGDQNLFFAVYIHLASPALEDLLSAAGRDAWIWLRYQIPTIASSVCVHDEGVSTFVYESGSSSEIDQWADRTFIVSKRQGGNVDLDELRRQLGSLKVPSDAGDQTWLHLVPGSAGTGSDAVSKFGLLLHTHHTPFDGVALKVVFTRFLKQLAKLLSSQDGSDEALEWGKEVNNLVPSSFRVLSSIEPIPIPPDSLEESTFTHPYYASMGAVMQAIGDSMQNAYGFKPRKADLGWPSPLRAELVFSKAESDTIFKCLKDVGHKDGYKKFTVTQLAHAALAMVAIFDNPPTPDASSHFLNNLSLINCRNRLREPYSSREGYPGYALGVSMARLPVSIFLGPDGKPLPIDEHLLATTLKVVQGIYMAQKATPAPLSYMGQASEIFCEGIKQALISNHMPPNQCYSISSDGIGEKYLDPVYPSSDGKLVLTVEKFFTSLNRTDPAPFFRISTWNGVMTLSADFNSNITAARDVKDYLDKWKEFMFLVSKLTGDDS